MNSARKQNTLRKMNFVKKFESVEELQYWLTANQIDTSTWGKGGSKTVDDLWFEILRGDSVVLADPARRSTTIVQIYIRRGKQRLIELSQELDDGQQRFRLLPPSEKVKPGESSREAALRCLQEELGVGAVHVTFLPTWNEQSTSVMESESYPGLTTEYTIHVLEAQVEGLPDADFWRDNLSFGLGDPVKRHLWGWR